MINFLKIKLSKIKAEFFFYYEKNKLTELIILDKSLI